MEKYTAKALLIQKRRDVLGGVAIFGTPAQEADVLREQSITIRNAFPPRQ